MNKIPANIELNEHDVETLMMKTLEINNKVEFDRIINSDKPVLIDF